MPYRRLDFNKGESYHVYNRGLGKQKIFFSDHDYEFFIDKLASEASKGKVKILSYCLMPNHYHLLMQSVIHNGIIEFMQKLQLSYSKYFNFKHHRKGQLFEGRYQAKFVPEGEILLIVSAYIHRNPLASGLVNEISDWQWSSFWSFNGNVFLPFLSPQPVIEELRRLHPDESYQKYVLKELVSDTLDSEDVFLDSPKLVKQRNPSSHTIPGSAIPG